MSRRKARKGHKSNAKVVYGSDFSQRNKGKRRTSMTSESTRVIQLSTDTIKNNIAAFLMATRTVKDADEITSMDFGEFNKDMVNITIKLNGREVKQNNNDEHFQIT